MKRFEFSGMYYRFFIYAPADACDCEYDFRVMAIELLRFTMSGGKRSKANSALKCNYNGWRVRKIPLY